MALVGSIGHEPVLDLPRDGDEPLLDVDVVLGAGFEELDAILGRQLRPFIPAHLHSRGGETRRRPNRRKRGRISQHTYDTVRVIIRSTAPAHVSHSCSDISVQCSTCDTRHGTGRRCHGARPFHGFCVPVTLVSKRMMTQTETARDQAFGKHSVRPLYVFY